VLLSLNIQYDLCIIRDMAKVMCAACTHQRQSVSQRREIGSRKAEKALERNHGSNITVTVKMRTTTQRIPLYSVRRHKRSGERLHWLRLSCGYRAWQCLKLSIQHLRTVRATHALPQPCPPRRSGQQGDNTGEVGNSLKGRV
jgi:hypothetical protein